VPSKKKRRRRKGKRKTKGKRKGETLKRGNIRPHNEGKERRRRIKQINP
jgi:hypothetical protein